MHDEADDGQRPPPMLRRLLYYAGLALALAFLGLTVLNASWLAPAPRGHMMLIAHRGVAQQYGQAGQALDGCPAAAIEPPIHHYLENTLPSLKEARALGGAMVELDIAPTTDGQLVVFDDGAVDCRTGGQGDIRKLTLAQIKALDAGYGYTADGGKTYPLRGRGEGMIPSLAEFLGASGRMPLMFNFKSRDPGEADALAAALKAAGRDPVALGDGFYGRTEEGPVARMREIYPRAWVFSQDGARACTKAYALQGWFGITPASCRNGTMMIPLDDQWAMAGWPNRLIARMQAVGTRIVVLGPDDGRTAPRGLDLPEQLGEVPASFNGYLWVEDIWNIGPALFPSTERRSPAEWEAAQRALEQRRAKRQ